MKYVFGSGKLRGKLIHILKTVGDEHTYLTGANQVETSYPECVITDGFTVTQKYLSKEDASGKCYDWYEIKDHYRYIDYFTPMKEQIATDTADLQNALCDFSADLDEMLADIENALCELTEE